MGKPIQKSKKILMLILSIVLTAGLVGTSVALDVLFSKADEVIPTIQDTVVLGGVKYTNDNPLRILEIVPDESAGELGYMVGKEFGTVRWSDILRLPQTTETEQTNKINVIKKWAEVVSCYNGYNTSSFIAFGNDGKSWKTFDLITRDDLSIIDENTLVSFMQKNENTGWQPAATQYYYDYDGVTLKYNDNMFAYAVFGGYDMCDKVVIETKSANDVTVEDIRNAQYIYINNSMHIGESSYSLYQLMYNSLKDSAGDSEDITQLKEQYCREDFKQLNMSSSNVNFVTNQVDLSAEAALELVSQCIRKEVSVSFDKNAVKTGGYSDYNIGKVFMLLYGIDRDTLYEGYFSNGREQDKFTGTTGSVYLTESEDSTKKVLEMEYLGTQLVWKDQMFLQTPYPNSSMNDIYHSPLNYTMFVNENAMLYNGDNMMGIAFVNGNYTHNGGHVAGSTDEELISLYGEIDQWGNAVVKNSLVIQYILGGYKNYQPITQIRVLEIDPAGGSKYNDYAGALKLAQYIGVSFDGMTADNYGEFVKLTTVASNAFIAMTDDLKNAYDLIVITDYNRSSSGKNIIKFDNNMIYTKYAEKMTLDETLNGNTLTAAMSGNDFTDKALDKLYQYLKCGKPMVIAPCIYDDTTSLSESFTVDKSGVNVYKLSSNHLLNSNISTGNILREPVGDETYEKVKYCNSPVFTMDDKYKVGYNEDVIDATVDSSELRNYIMTGKIGNYANFYNVTIWFDKDGDGLFTSGVNGSSELYFDQEIRTNSDGTFSVTMTLPENMRGYVKWKAIVKEYGVEYGTEDTGAIAIKYSNDEKKTINVLQITPGNNTNLDMTAGSEFDRLFQSTEDVTGLHLNVTRVTTDTFKSWYGTFTYVEGGADYDNPEKNKLIDYDMVVIGFADDFNKTDIESNNAISNLKDFIDKGKSVLFTHDTMIYSSYSDGQYTNEKYKKDGKSFSTSYRMTSKFRDLIGMDRFHASVSNNGLPYQQGFTNAFLMKRAALNGSKYSMYTDLALEAANSKVTITTDSVSKLNTGQVTEYPYKIPDTLSVAETHAQWFQLDLEAHNSDYSDSNDDVVVWYTLGASNSKSGEESVFASNETQWQIYTSERILYAYPGKASYNGTPVQGEIPNEGQFIRFNPSASGTLTYELEGPINKGDKTTYYIVYRDSKTGKTKVAAKETVSKGNRLLLSADVEAGVTYYMYADGNGFKYAERIRLKSISLETAVAATTWSYEYLSYVLRGETTIFTPSVSYKSLYPYSNYYDLAGQDALNNYYIYSKGNITYSGAGHAEVTGEDELKLFVNTVIKAYGSGNNAPEIQVEQAVSLGGNVYEKYLRSLDDYSHLSNLPEEERRLLREGTKVTFTATDLDMGASTTTAFTSGDIYWDVNGNGSFDDGDVVLQHFGEDTIFNRIQNTIYLYDYMEAKAGSSTFQDALKAGTVKLGIMVYDNKNLSGQCTLHVIARELFKLE